MPVDVKFGWEEARLQEPRHQIRDQTWQIQSALSFSKLVVEEKQRHQARMRAD